RLRQAVDVERRRSRELFVDDLVTEIDAFVADVDARASDQLLDLALRLAAEAAKKLLVRIRGSGHYPSRRLSRAPPTRVSRWVDGLLRVGGWALKVLPISSTRGSGQCSAITRSMMLYSTASSALMK